MRQLIRQTWASSNNQKNLNLKVFFIIGQTNENFLKKMIEIEHSQNNDLIQGNFEDTYRHLSYKVNLKNILIKKTTNFKRN